MKKIITLALALAPLHAFAAEITSGNTQDLSSADMQQLCQNDSVPCEIFISGMLTGATGGLMTSEFFFERTDNVDTDKYIDVIHKKLFGCIPEEINHRQLYEVWVKFLDANPDRLGEDAAFTMWDASSAAFPCD